MGEPNDETLEQQVEEIPSIPPEETEGDGNEDGSDDGGEGDDDGPDGAEE